MNWRHSYEEHQRMIRDQLHQAASAGVPVYRLASGVVDPRKLSYGEIARIARKDAEVIVNMAVNQELERKRRKG